MRVLRRALLVLAFVIAGMGFSGNNARAEAVQPDDFTYNSAYQYGIDTGKWTVNKLEDPNGQIAITTENNRLEFYRQAEGTKFADVTVESLGKYELTSDFHVSVDYHNSVVSPNTSEIRSTIWLNMDYGDSYGFDIAARSGGRDDSAASSNYFTSALWIGDSPDTVTADRLGSDGVFDAFYSSKNDTLTMSALYKKDDGTYATEFSRTYEGINKVYNITELQPSLETNIDPGAMPAQGELFFDNFNVPKTPTAAPEPLSCLLFGLGSAVFAVRRKVSTKW